MKQFGEVATWLKGHISLISLIVLGVGNHLVSDELFACPCGEDVRRYVYTISLACTPAVLLILLDTPWKTVYVSRVINGCLSSCTLIRRPMLLALGWIIYCFLEPKFTSCITKDGTCKTEEVDDYRKSLIMTSLAGCVLLLSLFVLGGRVGYHMLCTKTILSQHDQQIGTSENRRTEDSNESCAGCSGWFSKTPDPEEETIKRSLRGLDWKILSLIVDEGLVNAKVLKGLKDPDFEKFENRINMGQWKTLREKCEMMNLPTQGSGEMNLEATSPAVDRSASSSDDHAADSQRNENSPQNPESAIP